MFCQVGAIAPTPPVALALGPLVTVICMLFGGFYINLKSIPLALRWISNLSPIKWAFVGFSINELEGEIVAPELRNSETAAEKRIQLKILILELSALVWVQCALSP